MSAKHPFPSWISRTITAFYEEECGISRIFDWQNEVLQGEEDEENKRRNLVFSAPTSAGKSLVAELIAWRVAKSGKKVLFVLPYISVAREKLHILQKSWRRDDISVAGFIGPHASNPNEWIGAVCTIEKAAGLVNRALSEEWFDEIGMIVVDELHMIFDGSRGTHIDHMLTKILFWNSQNPETPVRIIGMSATIPQINNIGKWLNAKIHVAKFRPVELVENVIIGQKMRKINTSLGKFEDVILRDFCGSKEDAIVELSRESYHKSIQTLIMCSSKIEVENVAKQIAGKFSELKKISSEVIKNRMEGLLFVRQGLERNGCKDRILIGVLGLTIGFHHAGLTLEERECIEQGFRDGHILILVATSTLASGVNLPAERVIIKSQTRGPSPLNSMTYKQMIGRAGRMGHAKKGRIFWDENF
ncbi:unnamed protein product [Caenorhabditis angaria]|uniref:Uncharacterized protein n=1 Tax=Caenorhabditis angaria TaxID=860376 RepID=A0A9P1IH09_9PELO|nr:unnamed protein product [Caenorhabditis angaria]